MQKRILGIDLGTNSIGWALLNFSDDNQPAGIENCGVRVFQEAVEAKTRTPKNHLRRAARGARKVLSRRKMRRSTLLHLLQESCLLPKNEAEVQRLLQTSDSNPYELRKRGLDQSLELYEFGRALYHLNKRRGFLSNRKTDKNEPDKKKQSELKLAMSSLANSITESGSRTLGEYLANQPQQRKVHTTREMFQQEFELLWESQQVHHPDILTGELRASIYRVIFFQRPLKIQKNLVGKCTLEPTRKRAARAIISAQRFRILQDINHLEVRNPATFEWRKLTDSERQKLFTMLDGKETLTWLQAKRALGLHDNELFNMEEGKKEKLLGNTTVSKLRKVLGDQWNAFSEVEQNSLVDDLLTIENDAGLIRRLSEHWTFHDEIVQKLSSLELENGYTRLSHKAILKLLPFLQAGLRYDEACVQAGYHHSMTRQDRHFSLLGGPSEIRNPVVQKALWETRKVVNALIRKYGKPDVIRVEMAREMKMSKKQRDDHQKEQKRREKENDQAKQVLRSEFGITEPTRSDLIKYRLWVESDHLCPYTGQSISGAMLFSPEVDVEHILPYSRCLDDSYMNKTLCMATENRLVKRNQSPYEAYANDAEKFDAMLVRVAKSKMPFMKKRRFEQKEIQTDEFIERQLNDTRYICVEVKEYLLQLGVPVEVSKGSATADLRHHWELNRILDPDNHNSKNRSNHLHHGIDAIVISLTSRGLFQKLSRISQQSTSHASLTERGFHIEHPWSSFLPEVRQSIQRVTISHAASRKVSGALHEETAYGIVSEPDEKGYQHFTVRKSLASFDKKKQLESIRDDEIRKLVTKRLEECDGDFKRAFGNEQAPLLHKDGKTPIRSVRIVVKFDASRMMGVCNARNEKYKFHSMGSNHHVEIIENMKTGVWKGLFITTYEAAQRVRNGNRSVIQTDHGSEWKFVMSLCPNDTVEFDVSGERRIFRVQKMSDPSITFRSQFASTLDDDADRIITGANPLKQRNSRKITVSPIGEISECRE